jgi:peptidoglycan/LPS O-acetylase OafA/YrhL
MESLFKFIFVFIFVFFSLVLLYHRRFRRWLSFSFSLLVLYLITSYLIFNKIPMSEGAKEVIQIGSLLLFLFGGVIVWGFCMFRDYCWRQITGAVVGFEVLSLVLIFVVDVSIGYNSDKLFPLVKRCIHWFFSLF